MTQISAWAEPWQIGGWSDLAIEPFDATEVLARERSLVQFCTAAPGIVSARSQIIPCGDCPSGHVLGLDGGLVCRETPVCRSDADCGQNCQLQPEQPFISGSCDACVDYGCDATSRRCSCR